jgi:amino acid adenylation domain-containing protein
VVFGSEVLSYGELVTGARRLARHMVALGVGPEVPVAVLLGRRPGLVTALLGVLEAGGCYLPLDPSYPAERLALMAADAGVAAVVTEASLAEAAARVAPAGARLVVVDGEDRDAIAARSAEAFAPAADAGPDRLAYLLYTSGSTGRPKGVGVCHRSAVAFLGAMARRPGLGPEDVVLATTTVSFDISLLELFLPLAEGARIVLVDRETAADGRALAPRLDDVTVAQATPTAWRMLLDAGWRGRRGLRILSGGEALDRELAGRLLAAVGPDGEVWNVFGPTETTVWSAAGRVAPGAGPVPVGRPIDGTRLAVMDRRGGPCPPGVAGELWIGGAGVARGYRGLPAATAERFVPDPCGLAAGGAAGEGAAGARAYRTGDLARWDPDGSLKCLGRLDHQVKIRGHRIEPGEIEAVLLEHPAVAQAAVAVRELPTGEPGLVAYVVRADGDGEPSGDALRRFLRDRLPEAMVPAAFAALGELPLGPTGKLDRRALPEPDPAHAPETAPERPRSPVEEVVAQVWSRVLGRPEVGVRQSFFDLGGHSLLALRVTANLGRIFQLDLPAQAVFVDRTVEGLGQRLERSLPDPATAERIALTFLEVQALTDEELGERGA